MNVRPLIKRQCKRSYAAVASRKRIKRLEVVRSPHGNNACVAGHHQVLSISAQYHTLQHTYPHAYKQQRLLHSCKGKVKVMSICRVSIDETSLRRSGTARIVKGYHSFTCTPCVSTASGMSCPCLCLPSHRWYSFTDPGGMEAE